MQDLYNKFLASKGVIIDNRQSVEGKIFFSIKGENFDGNNFAQDAIKNGAIAAVVERNSRVGKEIEANGNDGSYFIVENSIETLQSLARWHRSQFNIPIVALTGTNGKTTTKELIATLLSQRFSVTFTKGNLNNHIGVPLTLLGINFETEIAVIEMGASSEGEVELLMRIALPTCGLVTNVGKAHLQGFGSFEGVKKAKGELYDYLQRTADPIFYNADNPHLLMMISSRMDLITIPYGISIDETEIRTPDSQHPFLRLITNIQGERVEINTNLIGSYNTENVLSSIAVAKHFGVSTDKIIKALSEYLPSNNRSQLVRIKDNFIIVDAYNANPSSMNAALDNFALVMAENKIAILGDMLELGCDSMAEHNAIISKVENLISESKIDNVFFIGAEFIASKPTSSSNSIQYLGSVEEIKMHLPFNKSYILLKGSNGIGLPKIIDYL